jgi:predicted ATP-grasp superfamily ATP-dependent carboligase
MAFEGWNDAGEAASAAVDHLIYTFSVKKIFTFDPEPYYDFQVNRPIIRTNFDGKREIQWRTTHIYKAEVSNGKQLFLIRGVEPSMHWKSFSKDFLNQLKAHKIDTVIALGALLSDTPHTRPISVTAVALDQAVADKFDVEISQYEGPTGIIGVLQQEIVEAGLAGLSLWAAIPHYVSQPPSPKATMALLDHLDNLLDLPIPLGDYPERTKLWLQQVNALIQNDEDVAEYVSNLEQEGDVSDLPMASGDAIAKEFERYLRRRDDT